METTNEPSNDYQKIIAMIKYEGAGEQHFAYDGVAKPGQVESLKTHPHNVQNELRGGSMFRLGDTGIIAHDAAGDIRFLASGTWSPGKHGKDRFSLEELSTREEGIVYAIDHERDRDASAQSPKRKADHDGYER
jgi:hypothetical protein